MAVTIPLAIVPSRLPGAVAPLDRERADGAELVLGYRAEALIDAYRWHGHHAAALDPLSEPPDPVAFEALDPLSYGLAPDDSTSVPIELGGAVQNLAVAELMERLRCAYCGPLSLECTHVRSEQQRRWLHARVEQIGVAPEPAAAAARRLLEQLIAVEAFEQRRREAYPQYKQFNLEGSESFVALLRMAIEHAVRQGASKLVLAMPHRGRLNVMLNALAIPAQRLLSLLSPRPDRTLAAGDLRDHAGFSGRVETEHGGIDVLLLHNPSHLESVAPVACGVARALQDRSASVREVLPVLVHGDGSFCGQGVVAETLNLAQTRGYGVGGTVHLILNNQIGSTISHPRDQRSTLYCADLARGFDAPILHVNADDAEAVVAAAHLAVEFRMRFAADIVVDHVGYRRYGHWVGDDPTMTRPAMQRRIDGHPAVAAIYAGTLARRGIVAESETQALKAAAHTALEAAAPAPAAASGDAPSDEGVRDGDAAERGPHPGVHTSIPIARLRALATGLAALPDGFAPHAAVDKALARWRAIGAGEQAAVDWRLAENLAYATLLASGFNVRLTGLDVGRGSFCHRLHLLHDQAAEVDGRELHVPLRSAAGGSAVFSLFESALSEEAVLGFEYGYSLRCGRDLVIWEGQFGDFVNNAQVIIDQFVAAGEAKWGYRSGLVMLLPHGDDGLGPEHSCAFLGRFLQLCAGGNIEVALPSTAAQIYHLLRRQALRHERKPLVVMTPKPWLYSHEPSHSRLHELADGEFRLVLGDGVGRDPGTVRRLVVTSGKFYYCLAAQRERSALRAAPILRIETLYPFPVDALARELARYPALSEVVWAQEEPKNHGAWYLVRDRLEAALPAGASLAYTGRPPMAPSAGCDPARHEHEQRDIARAALGAGSA